MPESLRFDGETDAEFCDRVRSRAEIARVLVEACLANLCVQASIADPGSLLTEAAVRTFPVVRIEYEQAIAIGEIGATLAATRSKHWGAGPQVLPLQPDDRFFERHITYIYRENSLYNRRYLQRQRMKQL
ncbi:MAG: hypothetical protein ACK5Q5_05535, partial [Planctomycetaceae bacterium]